MLGDLALPVVIGSLAALFLHALYRSLELAWPTSYFSLERSVDPIASRHAVRYAIIRLAPVFLAGLFVGVTLQRLRAPVGTGIYVLAVLHAFPTHIRGAWRRLRGTVVSSSATLAIWHIIATIVVLATAYAGWWSSRIAAGLVPTPSELSANLWAGIIAAVLAVYLQKVTSHAEDYDSLLQRSKEEVDPGLIAFLHDEGVKAGLDGAFLEAILHAENVQRPPWFRRLENLGGRITRRGSYGIMQVKADEPIDDRESIRRTIRTYRGLQFSRPVGEVPAPQLEAAAEAHNGSREFIDMVIGFYHRLGLRLASTEAIAPDGEPLMDVREVRREGWRWSVSGTAYTASGRLMCVLHRQNEASREEIETSGSGGRFVWSYSAPLQSERLEVLTFDDLIATAQYDESRQLNVYLEYGG